MKRRITRAIVGVTALVIVVLGVPLAIVVQHFYESRAEIELQRTAAEAIAELTLPLRAEEIESAAAEPDAPSAFSVYDDSGVRLFGTGPPRLDADDPGQLVVESPITDRTSEEIVGTVRVSQSRDVAAAQARRAWAVMALAMAGGLGLALVVARREAARLADPVTVLADRAERLGDGEFDLAMDETGVPEVDVLARALTASGRRLAELVVREREFSANASHQLRTPLAGLQVSLEQGDLIAATAQAARLSETVDHMLALARDALPTPARLDIAAIVRAAANRWTPQFSSAGRPLIVEVPSDLPEAHARAASIEHTLDVLLENSLRHGDGMTRITARPAPGGVVIQVDDDGPGIDADSAASIFERHDGVGNGIGLALARTLVEADGGRLLLVDPVNAGFHLVLVAARLRPN